LLGSNFYVDHPALPLGKAIAMINMDMIGRLRSGQLFIGGVATGSTFKKIVDEANRPARFEIESADHGGYGSSDQYSFTPKQIPFMFFFTGLHPDYHTPSDTWDKIDAGSTARLVDFIAAVAQRLVDSPQRPRFVKPSR
jgi:Zn-dependent M28 family amino/carboxypeptidase